MQGKRLWLINFYPRFTFNYEMDFENWITFYLGVNILALLMLATIAVFTRSSGRSRKAAQE